MGGRKRKGEESNTGEVLIGFLLGAQLYRDLWEVCPTVRKEVNH